MHLAAPLVLALTTAAASAADEPAGVITAPTIRVIESQLVMPAGAEPLANYDRYYRLDWIAHGDFVGVRMLLRSELGGRQPEGSTAVPGVPNAFVIPRGGRLPDISDAGCRVVTVIIDPKDWNPIPATRTRNGKPQLAFCNPTLAPPP